MSDHFYIGVDHRPVTGLKYAIVVPLDYDFSGSGILFPPIIKVNVDNGRRVKPFYNEVEFILVRNQAEAAKSYGVTQQTISRWIEQGKAYRNKQG